MTMLTTAAPIFQRAATNHVTQLAQIVAAYTAAGIEAPTPALGIRDRINTTPSADQVAARLADQALNAVDPDQWYSDALEQIRDAMAADALKLAFARNYSGALNRALPSLLAQATADLTPSFDKASKALTAAAKSLPAGTDALSPEANIESDTGSALSKARAAIKALSGYANIYQLGAVQDAPPALVALLPILELPTAIVEKIARSLGEDVTTLNSDQIEGAQTIRRIAQDARDHGPDQVIINTARGDYEGASLNLADVEAMRDRRNNAARAHQRQSVQTNNGRIVII